MAMDDVYSGRKGKKCVIYIRVSSERQVQGYSLEGQKRYLKEWAEFEGMTVTEIYVEPGKSGKSISGREVFQRMLDDISTGRIDIDYVLVFKLSRFGRNAKDILNSLTYIKKYGVNLICKEDGLDSSTAMGRMMITILGAVAEMERENILVQTMLGREEKAKQGGWNGGFPPYGYERVNGKLVVVEDEARIVRLIFDKYVNEGMGFMAISTYLNRQGITRRVPPNVKNERFSDWAVHNIKRVVDNPIYTGRVVFGRLRQERKDGTENEYMRVKSEDYIMSDEISHEPIITDELFREAQMRRKEASQISGWKLVGREPSHLLSSILKCPMCGSSMYTDIKKWTNKDGTKRQKVYYECGHHRVSKGGQCRKNSIPAEWIEAEVVGYTKLLVRNPKFAEDIQKQIGQKVDVSEIDAEEGSYRRRLNGLERSKANLERDIDGIFDGDRNAERKRQDMNSRLNKIYEEIYDIEEKIRECEKKKGAVEKNILTQENIYKLLLAFDRFFDKMDAKDQRKLLESMVSEVRLYPKEEWGEGRSPIKEIKYTFSTSEEVLASLGENVTTVEAVV
ncbi:MAG: recombinase family protein [Ruminococcus flavefaciens]|nr:recombinase family protein [Ruminococcus flavefaciens]